MESGRRVGPPRAPILACHLHSLPLPSPHPHALEIEGCHNDLAKPARSASLFASILCPAVPSESPPRSQAGRGEKGKQSQVGRTAFSGGKEGPEKILRSKRLRRPDQGGSRHHPSPVWPAPPIHRPPPAVPSLSFPTHRTRRTPCHSPPHRPAAVPPSSSSPAAAVRSVLLEAGDGDGS